jgi:hypothetical protein
MRDKTRNAARQAARQYSVEDNISAEEFCELYKMNLAARKWPENIDLAVVAALIEHSRLRGQGEILLARNEAGIAKAAIFRIWDQTACYYLLSTRTLDSGNGAITLLLWSAIQRAIAMNLTFDFDGFGYAGAVLFYAGFGAQIRPRYIVSKSTAFYRLLREMRRKFVTADNPFT